MSTRINAELRIELMSDLCSGSGYSYAGIIDSDICYDIYGIPYIPAKRLKGCLRDTLENSLYTLYPGQADSLFGRRGEDKVSDFVIADAVVGNYKTLKALIAAKRATGGKMSDLYGTQNILGRFTHLLAQTKIRADGTAEDNSLRYTRVVNQYSPLTMERENMTFYAEVSFSSQYKDLVRDTVMATRHIGLKRNRGLGNVRCSLENVMTVGNVPVTLPGVSDVVGQTMIYYTIYSLTPLMLSGADENISRTYIAGQSVLGALAGRYLSFSGKNAESDEFRDLFLNGTVQFGNAYPSDGEMSYYPAPLYINRLKKTNEYVCILQKDLPDYLDNPNSAYNRNNGNQPEKLRGKYLNWKWGEKDDDGNSRGVISEFEIAQDVVYHHRHDREAGDEKTEKGILYSMEVIRPNQCFRGMICLPKKYVPIVEMLLKSGDFYFGKSRSSQYGRCSICIDNGDGQKDMNSMPECRGGDHLIVTFLSDALFCSDRGEYTVYQDEVEEIVRRELGIKVLKEKDPEYLTSIQTTEATGYLGIWKLRKDVKPAVAAGSYVVYHLAEPFVTNQCFIGERTLEGYGQIMIERAEDTDYEMKSMKVCSNAPEEADVKMLAGLMTDVILDTWLEQVEYKYLKNHFGRIAVTNTALGRITMMLKESLEQFRDDSNAAFQNFVDRIESIKSNDTRKKAEEFLKLVGDCDHEGKWMLLFAQKVLDGPIEAKDEPGKLGIKRNDLENRINQRWGNYLMYILTEQKYEGGVG